jgi:spore germination protein GerM
VTPPPRRRTGSPGLDGSAGPIPSRLWFIVGAASLIAGIGLVLWLLPHWLTRDRPGPATGAASSAEARRIRATLFYVSDDGNQLVAVDREVPFSAAPADQARRIIEAQVAPAPEGLISPIPAGTTVRNLYITPHGQAYVDLSHEIATAHSGGSLDEALTVFAIINALTVNLPDITAAQILIDGKEVDTLAGHLDLRRPLTRAPQWVRKDSPRS